VGDGVLAEKRVQARVRVLEGGVRQCSDDDLVEVARRRCIAEGLDDVWEEAEGVAEVQLGRVSAEGGGAPSL
jgi:hypothetical protein